jgi:hypothetical protein
MQRGLKVVLSITLPSTIFTRHLYHLCNHIFSLLHRSPLRLHLPPTSRTGVHLAWAATTLSKDARSSRLSLPLTEPSLPPGASGPSSWLHARTANVMRLHLRCHGKNQQPVTKHVNPGTCTLPSQSPLNGTADHLENLLTEACVELARRLPSTVSSLPTGEARPRAVLKTVILFIAEYGSAA